MHCLNVLAHMLIVNTGQHTFNGTWQHFLLVLKYINEVINLSRLQSDAFVCVWTRPRDACMFWSWWRRCLLAFWEFFGINHSTWEDASVQPFLIGALSSTHARVGSRRKIPPCGQVARTGEMVESCRDHERAGKHLRLIHAARPPQGGIRFVGVWMGECTLFSSSRKVSCHCPTCFYLKSWPINTVLKLCLKIFSYLHYYASIYYDLFGFSVFNGKIILSLFVLLDSTKLIYL